MKIRYVHSSAPRTQKIHDTEKSFKNCLGFIHGMGSECTQEQWDQFTLNRFAEDEAKGIVCSYAVVQE